MEMQNYRELILENIEYDYLRRQFATYREDLDEIVELIVERSAPDGKLPGSPVRTSP